MVASHFIKTRVSPEMKALFRTLAEQQQVTESVLLKRMVDLAVRSVGQSDAQVLKSRHRPLRGSRLCVRLHPDDQLLLSERAAARQMAAATYVSVLVRSHLRSLAPLPKAELMALKRSVAELGAFGRNVNQLVRLAHQGGSSAGLSQQHVLLTIKVCEASRARTKAYRYDALYETPPLRYSSHYRLELSNLTRRGQSRVGVSEYRVSIRGKRCAAESPRSRTKSRTLPDAIDDGPEIIAKLLNAVAECHDLGVVTSQLLADCRCERVRLFATQIEQRHQKWRIQNDTQLIQLLGHRRSLAVEYHLRH